MTPRPIVQVECALKVNSTISLETVREHLEKHLKSLPFLLFNIEVSKPYQNDILDEHVDCVKICESMRHECDYLDHGLLQQADLDVYMFQLNEEQPFEEIDDQEDLVTSQQWMLPSRELHPLWDTLIFDDDIKSKLLCYMNTAMLFSTKHVNSDIIGWNRVVLLHGPPGTGKTSLCKALAQKLSIRLSRKYSRGLLVEINSHSLFSKWFSESGKLVMKMFQKIDEFMDDEDSLICLLIDEVESLAAARQSGLSKSEPSDAIRVVNALLTQIDRLRKKDNVLILTTSNITGAIDLAFVDRADIKQFVGHPSAEAIYSILYSCMMELMRADILRPSVSLVDPRSISIIAPSTDEETIHLSYRLFDIARHCSGWSGRTLRKLPFLAHVLFAQGVDSCTVSEFLVFLRDAVVHEERSRQALK